MGWTFGNIHVKKNDVLTLNEIAQKLKAAYYAQSGYHPCEQADAELSFAIMTGSDSDWLSIYSDFFEEPQERVEIGRWLAQDTGVPVLDVGCFDSDILGLILHHPEGREPAQAVTGGMAQEMGLSLCNEDGWRSVISDMSAFRDALEAEWILAEEVLDELAALLHLPSDYSKNDLSLLAESNAEPIFIFLSQR